MVTPWTNVKLTFEREREGRKVKYTNPTFVLYFELTTAPRSHWRRWYGATRFSASEQRSDWLSVFTWGHCLQEKLCFLWSEHRTAPNRTFSLLKSEIRFKIFTRFIEENMWSFTTKIGLKFLNFKTARFLPPLLIISLWVLERAKLFVTFKLYLMNFRW